MRIQLAIPEQRLSLCRTLQPDLHGPRIRDDVSVCDPDLRGASQSCFFRRCWARGTCHFHGCPRLGSGRFLIGGIFLCGSIFFDAAPRGGWFMYPPLTTQYQPGIGADIWLLGFSFIEVAAIAAAVEMIVGALKCRPPGMRINLMPLYVWYVLVAAAMILFAFPPLIAGSLLLEVERAFQWPFFNPARRRRSAAVAAPVLAFRPSGGLHHLPAVCCPDRNDRADIRAADRSSAIPGWCWPRSAQGFSASVCGCTTCSPPGCPASHSACSPRRRRPWQFPPASRSSVFSRR